MTQVRVHTAAEESEAGSADAVIISLPTDQSSWSKRTKTFLASMTAESYSRFGVHAARRTQEGFVGLRRTRFSGPRWIVVGFDDGHEERRKVLRRALKAAAGDGINSVAFDATEWLEGTLNQGAEEVAQGIRTFLRGAPMNSINEIRLVTSDRRGKWKLHEVLKNHGLK